MYNESLVLTAPQHTAVKTQRRSKKCHQNFCRRITIFRAESTGMASIACCGITCTMYYPIIFLREAPPRLLVCRPNLRFNNTTNL
jgi:hypothetical protein